MIVAATIGSVVGVWILYGISAWIGRDRLHPFIGRYGKWFGVKPDDIIKAEVWFDRRSTYAVLFGRCVPVIRSLVSIPAGFRRMDLLRFTLFTAVGSAIWNIALISAGALLGDRWDEVGNVVGVFEWVVIVAIVGLVAWFVWRRMIRPKFSARAAARAAADDAP
jgi:membrane protein DedA with SNARE-associated domain